MTRPELTRRGFLRGMGGLGGMAALPALASLAAAGRPRTALGDDSSLSLWCAPIARPFTDWSPIEERAGVSIRWSPKSASADEALTKMIVGDGTRLYDAFTDNGGGMEDAMAENGVIAPLDPERLRNWNLLRPEVRDSQGAAAHSIRYKGGVFAIPYIANADSLAYLPDKLGFVPDSWEALFDSQFKGYVAMQDDFGPTLTNTAIYLRESGRVEIGDPSNMEPEEVKAVCGFLIDKKKQGQFRTFWNGFQQSVDLLVSQEVVMMSCWEPQVYECRRKGVQAEYGTMKEGHQVWNNVVMLTRAGVERGAEAAFYRLCDVFLSPWYTSRQLVRFGFASLTTGVREYINARPDEFDLTLLNEILDNKEKRFAMAGNAWQNVYPKHLRTYQEWWSRVQAA